MSGVAVGNREKSQGYVCACWHGRMSLCIRLPLFFKKKKICDRLTERHLPALGRKGGLKTVHALTFLLFPAAIKRVTPSFAKAGGRGGGVSRPARPRPRQIPRQLHKRPVILREGQIPDQLVMLLFVAASARVVSSSPSSSSLLSVPFAFCVFKRFENADYNVG